MRSFEDIPYQATLQDADNQILSTGEARFHSDKGSGEFWPLAPADWDSILKKAATVQTSEGHTARIVSIQHCLDEMSPFHLAFDFALA